MIVPGMKLWRKGYGTMPGRVVYVGCGDTLVIDDPFGWHDKPRDRIGVMSKRRHPRTPYGLSVRDTSGMYSVNQDSAKDQSDE